MPILLGFLLLGGWPTPLKNIKVSWDYEIPNIIYIYIYIMENKNMFQTTNQSMIF